MSKHAIFAATAVTFLLLFSPILAAGTPQESAGTIVQGKYVVTGEDAGGKLEVLRNGALYVENGVIKEIGAADRLREKYPKAASIGGERFVVTPGFTNGHHHTSGVTFFQTGMTDEALETWLGKMGRTRADRYYNELAGYLKQIRTGVTSVLQTDNASDAEKWVAAAKDSGIRVMVGLAVGGKMNPKFFESFEALWKKHITAESRVKLFFAPWGIHWASDELLAKITEEAKKYPTGVHVHLAETKYQEGEFEEKHKETLTQHAEKVGFLNPAVSCGHCVYLNDADIDILKKTGASVVTNPSSNLRLLSGVAPIAKMVRKGINVAIGMDGLAFNDDEDIFAEMKLCWYLHKGIGKNPEGVTAEEVFRMGTINGARALGLQEITGSLKVGKRADVVLIGLDNIEGIHLHGDIPIVEALLIRGKASDVDTVMVNGEILYQHRKFTRQNEEEILRKLKESITVKEAKKQ